MLQWRGAREKVFSIAVRRCTFFEKQPRVIWKGKPATQSLLQSYISICMLLNSRDCRPAQSGKKTSENEARDGNHISRDCLWELMGSSPVTFRVWFFQLWSLHRFIWFGVGKGAVCLFSSGIGENFQGDAAVEASCSIISHKKQDWSCSSPFQPELLAKGLQKLKQMLASEKLPFHSQHVRQGLPLNIHCNHTWSTGLLHLPSSGH